MTRISRQGAKTGPAGAAARVMISVAAVAAVAAVMGAGGCGPTIDRDESAIPRGAPEDAGAWLYWPVSLRIHPLSSVRRDDRNARRLEVRVDCRDQTNEPTKVVGTFLVVLETEQAEPASLRWTIPVTTVDEHLARFDAVTGLYRLDVAPAWTLPPREGDDGVVRVVLIGADGRRCESSHRIAW